MDICLIKIQILSLLSKKSIGFHSWKRIGLNSFRFVHFQSNIEKFENVSTFPEGILREKLFYPFHLYLFLSSIPNLFHHTISSSRWWKSNYYLIQLFVQVFYDLEATASCTNIGLICYKRLHWHGLLH